MDEDQTLENIENESRKYNILIKEFQIDTNHQEELNNAMENFMEKDIYIKVVIINVVNMG